MEIIDIKLERSEDFIFGQYEGKFDPIELDKSIKRNYPNVNKYKVDNFEDEEVIFKYYPNPGTFHCTVINYING